MEAWTDLYLELSRKITGTYIIQEAVENVNDLETSYPDALDNWAAMVNSEGYIYLYHDNQWNNTKLRSFQLNEIKWVDLWHEQVSYLTEELPFPTPAVFIAFNTTSCDDLGQLIQNCDTQVDFYLFYETFSDTYMGSYNQTSAIDFLRLLSEINTAFHGVSGVNFQTMRKVHIGREDSGGAGNLYRISFNCNIEDASAQKEFIDKEVNEIIIKRENIVKADPDDKPLFLIPEQ